MYKKALLSPVSAIIIAVLSVVVFETSTSVAQDLTSVFMFMGASVLSLIILWKSYKLTQD